MKPITLPIYIPSEKEKVDENFLDITNEIERIGDLPPEKLLKISYVEDCSSFDSKYGISGHYFKTDNSTFEYLSIRPLLPRFFWAVFKNDNGSVLKYPATSSPFQNLNIYFHTWNSYEDIDFFIGKKCLLNDSSSKYLFDSLEIPLEGSNLKLKKGACARDVKNYLIGLYEAFLDINEIINHSKDRAKTLIMEILTKYKIDEENKNYVKSSRAINSILSKLELYEIEVEILNSRLVLYPRLNKDLETFEKDICDIIFKIRLNENIKRSKLVEIKELILTKLISNYFDGDYSGCATHAVKNYLLNAGAFKSIDNPHIYGFRVLDECPILPGFVEFKDWDDTKSV